MLRTRSALHKQHIRMSLLFDIFFSIVARSYFKINIFISCQFLWLFTSVSWGVLLRLNLIDHAGNSYVPIFSFIPFFFISLFCNLGNNAFYSSFCFSFWFSVSLSIIVSALSLFCMFLSFLCLFNMLFLLFSVFLSVLHLVHSSILFCSSFYSLFAETNCSKSKFKQYFSKLKTLPFNPFVPKCINVQFPIKKHCLMSVKLLSMNFCWTVLLCQISQNRPHLISRINLSIVIIVIINEELTFS